MSRKSTSSPTLGRFTAFALVSSLFVLVIISEPVDAGCALHDVFREVRRRVFGLNYRCFMKQKACVGSCSSTYFEIDASHNCQYSFYKCGSSFAGVTAHTLESPFWCLQCPDDSWDVGDCSLNTTVITHVSVPVKNATSCSCDTNTHSTGASTIWLDNTAQNC